MKYVCDCQGCIWGACVRFVCLSVDVGSVFEDCTWAECVRCGEFQKSL